LLNASHLHRRAVDLTLGLSLLGPEVVAYSTQGAILELDKSWQTARAMTPDGIGYFERRTALLGPRPM